VIQLLAVWFLAYVTVFAFAADFTSMLASLKYPPPEAGLIVAVGAFGFLACALFAVAFAERLERKSVAAGIRRVYGRRAGPSADPTANPLSKCGLLPIRRP
jgi:predicted MFS family arabinose efflux permease